MEEANEPELIEMVAALQSSYNGLRYEIPPLSIPISTNKLLPSVEQAPKVELKELPDHLKYVFLGELETLPVIISSKLDEEQEEKTVEVLKKYKTAIGWTMADIKGNQPHQMCASDITGG